MVGSHRSIHSASGTSNIYQHIPGTSGTSNIYQVTHAYTRYHIACLDSKTQTKIARLHASTFNQVMIKLETSPNLQRRCQPRDTEPFRPTPQMSGDLSLCRYPAGGGGSLRDLDCKQRRKKTRRHTYQPTWRGTPTHKPRGLVSITAPNSFKLTIS